MAQVGAGGPRTLALSAELADGTLLAAGVAVDAEREPHYPVEMGLAGRDVGRTHPLAKAEQC